MNNDNNNDNDKDFYEKLFKEVKSTYLTGKNIAEGTDSNEDKINSID
jgi:hypothetical protein